MTKQLAGSEIAQQLTEQFPEAVIQSDAITVLVKAESLFQVASFLNSTPDLAFDYLENLSGVDYLDYFEVVYHLISIAHNHSLILKTRCYDRENPQVPSVTSIWQGANFQERETYDLMGISFEGHPDLRRIYLWDGFPGHPQRRDYL